MNMNAIIGLKKGLNTFGRTYRLKWDLTRSITKM